MNPAVVVAGGGAGGGGGKGRGKGSGSGNEGAGTGHGGEGAQGGEQSADGCGAGGNGACTNCGSQISRGDPFDVTTGEVYTIPKQDLFLPGTFGLKLVRKYTSSRRHHDVGLGWGWVHSLGWSFEREDGKLVIHTGDGRRVELPDIEEEQGQYSDGVWSVLKTAWYYAVDPGNEFVHLFAPLADGDENKYEDERAGQHEHDPYLLMGIVYRNRGHVSLEYDQDGKLREVTDSVGRRIRIRSTPEGRIAAIDVPNERGEAIVFAQFEYDSFGQLVAATDADGATTRYGYDEEHLLTRLTYPSGTTFYFAYDQAGRCVQTWGVSGSDPDPSLAEDVPHLLADGHTPAKGIYHCRADYVDEEYVEVIDSVRLQRFFAGPEGQVAKAVGARGQVTERTFDEHGNVATQTDPLGNVWTWVRDAAGRILKETSPEGHTIETKYDPGGREIEITDAAGGTTTIGRDARGEIEWVKDQLGAYRLFTRDERGCAIQVIDERSALHGFEYDAHANCLTRVLPTGARYQYQYDFWGRMIATRTPSGNEARYAYTPNGRLSEVVSFDGNVTRYRYDAIGNLVATLFPDGSVSYAEYAGHNWLSRLIHPDGAEIRVRRNREGWIESFENERGERHNYTLHLDGLVAEERDFVGISHRYGYDELGRVTSIDEGQGVHEFAYDGIGQLKDHTAPDGGQRHFEYDQRGEFTLAVQDGVSLRWQTDATGRVVVEEYEFDGATYRVTSEYDLGGARTRLTSSLGHEVQVRRDPAGQVIALWADHEETLQLERNGEGQVVRRNLPRGGAILQDWDREGRLRQMQIVPARSTEAEPARGAAIEPDWLREPDSSILGRSYAYTPRNELAQVSTSGGGAIAYEYDARHHLKSARSNDGYVEQFRIDATSNYHLDGADAPTRTFAPGSQLTAQGDWEYSYGSLGELTGKRQRLADGSYGPWWRFVWDGFGFLKAVHRPDGLRVEFEYDAFARRVKKAVYQDDALVQKVHYVWDLVTLLHEITFVAGQDVPQVRTYLYEDNDYPVPLAHRDGGPEEQFLHYVTDLNGYPRELVDVQGQVRNRIEHRVFGKALAAVGAMPTQFRFSGQYEDAETGLHYNRYRYYDPEMGRYISPDPIGLDGGLNLYAYTPNPIGWTDPMGWQHVMEVEEAPAGFLKYAREQGHAHPYKNKNRVGYRSGGKSSDRTPCPDVCKTMDGCHTEQKFGPVDFIAWDKQDRQQGGHGGQDETVKLKGKFPPCPNCHGALMRTAKETGARIEYKFGNNTVVYDGSSTRQPSASRQGMPTRDVEMEFHGADAQKLKPTYDNSTLNSGWSMPTQKPGGNAAPDWGVTHDPGAKSEYDKLMEPHRPPPRKRKPKDTSGGSSGGDSGGAGAPPAKRTRKK